MIVDTQQNGDTDEVTFDVEEATLLRPPCREHTVQLSVEFNDERRPLMSGRTEYSRPAGIGLKHKSKDLFSGWLAGAQSCPKHLPEK